MILVTNPEMAKKLADDLLAILSGEQFAVRDGNRVSLSRLKELLRHGFWDAGANKGADTNRWRLAGYDSDLEETVQALGFTVVHEKTKGGINPGTHRNTWITL